MSMKIRGASVRQGLWGPALAQVAAMLWLAGPALAQTTDTSTAAGRPADTIIQMPTRPVVGSAPLEAKVVLLRMDARFPAESWPEAERRAVAELRALGLQVTHAVAQARGTNARLAELGAAAAQQRAVASVRIVRAPSGKGHRVQIWLYDAATQKMVLRETRVADGGPDTQGRVALHVVELLHASLIEARLVSSTDSRSKGRLPPAVRRFVDRKPAALPPDPRWTGHIGAAGLFLPGGLSAEGGLALGASHRTLPWLSLGIELFAPILPSEVTSDEGSVTVALSTLEALVQVRPWPNLRVSPSLGLGLGVALVRASGESHACDVRGQVEWTAAMVTTGQVGANWRVSRSFSVIAAASVGLVVPQIEFRVGDKTLAELGGPLVRLTVGTQWTWDS